MADAGAIALVEVAADLASDDCAEHRADDDRDRAVGIVADLRADCAADHGAGDGTDVVAIAAAFDDAVVALPLLAGVADVRAFVLLAPAVRLARGPAGRRAPAEQIIVATIATRL